MRKLILFFLVLFYIKKVQAQDAQYSQYYANSLYLSPAFAGAGEYNSRAIFVGRYQWPGLDASYIYSTFSMDHYFENYNSGVGLIATSDYSSVSKLSSKEIGFMYSYQVDLSKKVSFRPALQINYVNRSIDYSRLTFGSQYNDNGFVGGNSNEQINHGARVSYADISTGALLFSDNYWLGFSANHLNTPNQSVLGQESNLPIKASIFGGYRFMFTPEWRKRYVNPDEEKSISPTFLYKAQGKSDQLDIGLYGRYNTLICGMWYRGIPIKVYKPERTNNDALVFLIGVVHKGFSIGYSFDYTISKLTMRSGGSHEISLTYGFDTRTKKKIQKRPRCPKF